MTATAPERRDQSTVAMKLLERQYRTVLPEKSYAVIRVDGKGFSKYTSGLQRPFDPKFTKDMTATAQYLCEHIDGAQFAYTQSAEVDGLALFDGRTHHLEGAAGVLEYVRWRQADAMKNSVGMLASHHFSHRELTGVSVRDRKAMLADKGVLWAEMDQAVRQGTFIRRQPTEEPVTYWHKGDEAFKTR